MIDDRWGICPLKEWCKYKVDICATKLPDQHCPLYQYFDRLMRRENAHHIVPNVSTVLVNTKNGSYIIPTPKNLIFTFESNPDAPLGVYEDDSRTIIAPPPKHHFIVEGLCDSILLCGEKMKI